jgi:hypothetical protein
MLHDVPHWQWEAVDAENRTHMRFNIDFDLLFDLDLDANGKAVCTLDTGCEAKGTCGKHGNCPKSPTYDLAKRYIDVSVWPSGFTYLYDIFCQNKWRKNGQV